ncbi:hypothetical protein A2U01_0079810, partial [Trifolium medium]|nr:hypothetical protein [Trifolium medium]
VLSQLIPSDDSGCRYICFGVARPSSIAVVVDDHASIGMLVGDYLAECKHIVSSTFRQ